MNDDWLEAPSEAQEIFDKELGSLKGCSSGTAELALLVLILIELRKIAAMMEDRK